MLAALLSTLLLGLPLADGAGAQSFRAGLEAYRRGDYATAEALWASLVARELSDGERAVLCYDLGNATFRQGRPLEAVAWFTAGVSLRPRDPDLWHNLEHARAEAGLEPADRGDLVSTTRRLLDSLTPAEAEWLAAGTIALWALLLALEALRGGALWRRLAWAGLVVVLAGHGPLVWRELRRADDPYLVRAAPTASLRSEPREDLEPIGELEAGAVVERIDALPLWVRVETPDGRRGWVPAEAVQSLRPWLAAER